MAATAKPIRTCRWSVALTSFETEMSTRSFCSPGTRSAAGLPTFRGPSGAVLCPQRSTLQQVLREVRANAPSYSAPSYSPTSGSTRAGEDGRSTPWQYLSPQGRCMRVPPYAPGES
jgi:hypothetical protein